MKSTPKAHATWFDSACLIAAGAIGTLSFVLAVQTVYTLGALSAAQAVLRMTGAGAALLLSVLTVLYQFRYRIVMVRAEELRYFAERERDFWKGRAWEALDARNGGGAEEDSEERGCEGGGDGDEPADV